MEVLDTPPNASVDRRTRRFAFQPDALSAWLADAWTGGERDIFPHDVLPAWRVNAEGSNPQSLIPNETLLGHGPFTCRLREWNGRRWRASIEWGRVRGWHGFDVDTDSAGTTLTHTLVLQRRQIKGWALFRPLLLWAVEAMFVRMDEALRTRTPSQRTMTLMSPAETAAMRAIDFRHLRNVHSRTFAHSIDRVRPWLAWLWSATDRDVFPRDYLPNFRINPLGHDPMALIPGVTKIGHGPAKFIFQKWDGEHWEASIDESNRDFSGVHGFRLSTEEGGSRLTHVLDARMTLSGLIGWPLRVGPLHNWALEALFDRLEEALATGAVPSHTRRPMPPYAHAIYSLWNRLSRGALAPVADAT